MKATIVALLLILGAGYTVKDRQPAESSLLTIDSLFEDRFSAESFGPVVWLEDEAAFTVLERSQGGVNEIIRHDIDTGDRSVMVSASRLVPPGEDSAVDIRSYAFNADRSHVLLFTDVVEHVRGGSPRDHSGDYWVLDLRLWTWHKLGADASPQSLRHAQFSPDGNKLIYIRDNNLFTEELGAPGVNQLTWDGTSRIFNGRNDSANGSMVNAGIRVDPRSQAGYQWSADGEYVAFVQADWTHVPGFYMINNTETLYPELVEFPYVKVGQKLAGFRVGVVGADGDDLRWLDLPVDRYDAYLMQMDWLADRHQLLLQVLNREQNTMRVYLADLDGEVQEIHVDSTEHAWLEPKDIFWIDNGNRFIFTSEKDGWIQLYMHEVSGRELYKITPDNIDIIDVHGVDEHGGWIYYIASPEEPARRYLYRVSLDGRQVVEKVTPDSLAGTNRYNVSGDFSWALHRHSAIDSPPIYRLISLPDHHEIRVLESNEELHAALRGVRQGTTEFFRVDIGEGIELDGYQITPPDMDPARRYPLIHYIYGEPAGQTVLDSWSGRRHLWHLMLAQQGYVVMSIDPRGTSAPRGSQWRKAIYGQLGYLAAEDHAAATRRVTETHPYIDSDRIGIYGHSGGGQMSLNLIFRYPDLYHVASPSSFVSHQRFYHPAYQERFMGLPENNADGYRNGSPITWAHQLEGELLIIHGTGDSNVHYQSFEVLINELVAQDKQFSMMIYPNREHGLVEGANTQRHLHRLRTDFFLRHMPPGPY